MTTTSSTQTREPVVPLLVAAVVAVVIHVVACRGPWRGLPGRLMLRRRTMRSPLKRSRISTVRSVVMLRGQRPSPGSATTTLSSSSPLLGRPISLRFNRRLILKR